MFIQDSPVAVIVCAAHKTFPKSAAFLSCGKVAACKKGKKNLRQGWRRLDEPSARRTRIATPTSRECAAVFGLITFERQSMARDH